FFLLILTLILIMSCNMTDTKKPLASKWDALFKNPKQLEQASKSERVVIKNALIKTYNISDITLANAVFENNDFVDFVMKRGHYSNLLFKGGSIYDAGFADSTLINVTFEGVTIEDVDFISATLQNVTFKNCKIARARIRNLKKSQVTFINTQVLDSEFFDSEVIFKAEHSSFDLAQAQYGTFENMQPGSSIELIDTSLHDANVGGTLSSFKAKGGSIIEVGIGDNIKAVVLDDVKLNASLEGNIESVTIQNSELESLAIAKNSNDVLIEDCKISNILSMIDGKYTSLSINNCNLNLFEPWSITANHLVISNSRFINTTMSDSKVNHLIMNNVVFENAKFDNAIAKDSKINNVKLAEGGEFNLSGTNIPLQ
ncbi:MAG: pentapeptide repeat-containing protein, partial [Gammaproteobacteria bacterium]